MLFKGLPLREGVLRPFLREVVEKSTPGGGFMGFCGFSVSGRKPDATTFERFRDRPVLRSGKRFVWVEMDGGHFHVGKRPDKIKTAI